MQEQAQMEKLNEEFLLAKNDVDDWLDGVKTKDQHEGTKENKEGRTLDNFISRISIGDTPLSAIIDDFDSAFLQNQPKNQMSVCKKEFQGDFDEVEDDVGEEDVKDPDWMFRTFEKR